MLRLISGRALLELGAAVARVAVQLTKADTIAVVVGRALEVGTLATNEAVFPPRAPTASQLVERARQVGARVAGEAIAARGAAGSVRRWRLLVGDKKRDAEIPIVVVR